MSSHQNLSIRLIVSYCFVVTIVYVSFLPISAGGNENLFHRFRKVYEHGNDGSFQACSSKQKICLKNFEGFEYLWNRPKISTFGPTLTPLFLLKMAEIEKNK